MILVLLMACAACRPEPEPTYLELEVAAPESPDVTVAAGEVVEGRYVDGEYGLSIAVPPGWAWTIGRAADRLRISMHHEESGVGVRVSTLPGTELVPPHRGACTWTFLATGDFRALPGQDEVVAATCTDDRPEEPLIMAYMALRREQAWLFEVDVPRQGLADNKARGDRVLRSLRW